MKIKKLFSIIIATIISTGCITGCNAKEKKVNVMNLENNVVNAYVTADSYNKIRNLINKYSGREIYKDRRTKG